MLTLMIPALWGRLGLVLVAITGASAVPPGLEQWSAERARAWHRAHPFRVGANYLPSLCANVFDMFDPASFDATLLAAERELRVARAVGFTTMRVFLHEELYFRHSAGFLANIERLLEVLDRHGMVAMLVLFDAVWRPDVEGAGVLPEVHNSAWVQCPTHRVLRAYSADDPSANERLRRYVTDVVARFASDPRVAVWDIYNEASMVHSEHWILPRLMDEYGWKGVPSHWLLDEAKQAATLRLLIDAFAWARSASPMQPLTSGIWTFPENVTGSEPAAIFLRVLLGLSDVISLHCYCEPDELELRLDELAALGRPILMTEFMARPLDSTLTNSLPIFRRHDVWAYTWGLFKGRSQTHLPWKTWAGEEVGESEPWFHDVFYENGTAYAEEDAKEIWWQTFGQGLAL